MISSLSYVQQQFFINSLVYPKDTSYNIPLVYKVEGDLNLKFLGKSLNSLIHQYDILRSSFKRKGKQFSRITHSNEECVYKIDTIKLPYEFEYHDLVELDNEIHQLFDLASWPLFRIKLFKLKDNISILSIVFHHIVIDLYSYQIFAKGLSDNYNHYKRGDSPNEKKLNYKYNDFVEREAKWLKSSEADKMLNFWDRELGDKKHLLNVPVKTSRPSMQSKLGKRLHFELSCQLSFDIKDSAERHSVAPFTILLAAYSILLHRLSGQDKIVIGVPLSNRRMDLNKHVFGPLINIVPVVINNCGTHQKLDLIRQVRLAMLKAHRNQELPFLYMLNTLNIKKSFAYSPVFQTGFAFEPKIDLSFSEIATHPLIIERKGAQLDLFMTYWEQEDKIHACLEYASDLFTETGIRAWIEVYIEILEELVNTI
ncbi:condensation domain-containing protein [Carboxylicivirga marina]|uniref:condensation domain-containing protein n=1 Tax=Carboxylicivirga marina TaxID=2800988 RepID=UPI0025984C10|nr:condensation domain-containing protein [uncultured Carboxylicivirga sp.]